MKIAGDCEINNRVILSSSVIINPKVRIGTSAMISSGCRISKDVPPYIVACGNPVQYGGVNKLTLENHKVSEKVQGHIANAYRLVFHGQTSVFDAVKQIEQQVPDGDEVRTIIKFIQGTQLGIIGKM